MALIAAGAEISLAPIEAQNACFVLLFISVSAYCAQFAKNGGTEAWEIPGLFRLVWKIDDGDEVPKYRCIAFPYMQKTVTMHHCSPGKPSFLSFLCFPIPRPAMAYSPCTPRARDRTPALLDTTTHKCLKLLEFCLLDTLYPNAIITEPST